MIAETELARGTCSDSRAHGEGTFIHINTHSHSHKHTTSGELTHSHSLNTKWNAHLLLAQVVRAFTYTHAQQTYSVEVTFAIILSNTE